jgi:hypothetical protein
MAAKESLNELSIGPLPTEYFEPRFLGGGDCGGIKAMVIQYSCVLLLFTACILTSFIKSCSGYALIPSVKSLLSLFVNIE